MTERNYRGSKIVPVRIDDATLTQIESIVARSVLHSKAEPYTVSSWIKTLIQRELNSLERRRAKKKGTGDELLNEMISAMEVACEQADYTAA